MTAWKRAMQGDGGLLALAAVLAAVVFVLPLALPIPLMDPDEGLSASIAQEMAERGDWLTPRLLGRPFLDKPILYFWAEALSLRVFGSSESAVRLPGLLFGLLGAACTAAVGWRLLGRTTGLIAGMFYTTMVLPAAMTQAPVHDVLMVPCVCLALLGLWEGGRMRRRPAFPGRRWCWDGSCTAIPGAAVQLPPQRRPGKAVLQDNRGGRRLDLAGRRRLGAEHPDQRADGRGLGRRGLRQLLVDLRGR